MILDWIYGLSRRKKNVETYWYKKALKDYKKEKKKEAKK